MVSDWQSFEFLWSNSDCSSTSAYVPTLMDYSPVDVDVLVLSVCRYWCASVSSWSSHRWPRKEVEDSWNVDWSPEDDSDSRGCAVPIDDQISISVDATISSSSNDDEKKTRDSMNMDCCPSLDWRRSWSFEMELRRSRAGSWTRRVCPWWTTKTR